MNKPDILGSSQHWKLFSKCMEMTPCQRHCPLQVLATGPNSQSASLQGDPAFSVWEETRILVGKIMAASPWQSTYSQCPEYPVVPGWEEQPLYWNNLFIHSILLCVTFFLQAQRDPQGDSFWRYGGNQKGRNNRVEGHLRRIFHSRA